MIRAAVIDDSNDLQKLYQQLNPDDPVVDSEEFKKNLQKVINHQNFTIIVKEHNQKIVGSCYLNIVPNFTRSLRPYAVIENVVTDKEYRNQGHGKELLKYALEQAWQRNCYKAMLMTSSKEESVLNFYRAAGFTDKTKTAFIARNDH